MRTIVFLALLIASTWAIAQSRAMETEQEAKRRHEAERYETDRRRGGEALGGYSRERLGDPPTRQERPIYAPQPPNRDRIR